MFLIYSILYGLALMALIAPQYLKRPAEIRRRWLLDKFGFFDESLFISGVPPIWLHAVSVGEVNAAIPFLKKLKAVYPDIPIILSTITDTGQKVARQKASEGIHPVYLPFDLRIILNRCIRRVRPRIFIVIETELWPNILRTAAAQRIPAIILNGRISERSAKGYKKISFFMKKVLAQVTLFGMQSAPDADRIKSIGAEAGRVSVLGNFKFDMEIGRHIPAWMKEVQGPVVVAGSTHAGEEQIIIDAYRENVHLLPGLKLIIAPRHPERFAEAEDVISKSGIRYARRSRLGAEGQGADSIKYSILLLDTIGELTALYSIADIAIMGKSFEGWGGQNPLEPAFWGKPIICGEHMENFPFIGDFYAEGAAFEVTQTGLAKKIKELLLQPEKARSAGEKARRLYLKNSGAVDRAVEIVKGLVDPFPG